MSPSLKKLLAVVGVSGAVLIVSGVVLGGHDKELAAKADAFDVPDDRLESSPFIDSDGPVRTDRFGSGAQPRLAALEDGPATDRGMGASSSASAAKPAGYASPKAKHVVPKVAKKRVPGKGAKHVRHGAKKAAKKPVHRKPGAKPQTFQAAPSPV